MTNTAEKKRTDVSGLPPGWQREENMRLNGLSAGKVDVYYISPDGEKMRSKPQLARKLGDSFDLSCFDFRSGKLLQSALRKNKGIKGAGYDYTRGKKQRGRKARSVGRPRVIKNIGQKKLTAAAKSGKKRARGRPRGSNNKRAKKDNASEEDTGGVRHDANLVLPIRQTASIFKQPVTVIRNRWESRTRTDLKHGHQEQPKQLFWEKRLHGLRACDINEEEFKSLELPHGIHGTGPELSTENLLQSIAAALHASNQPVTGQSASRTALQKNPGVNINTEQPLIQAVVVTDQDIRRQEHKVKEARKKLEQAMTSTSGQAS